MSSQHTRVGCEAHSIITPEQRKLHNIWRIWHPKTKSNWVISTREVRENIPTFFISNFVLISAIPSQKALFEYCKVASQHNVYVWIQIAQTRRDERLVSSTHTPWENDVIQLQRCGYIVANHSVKPQNNPPRANQSADWIENSVCS